MPIIRLTCVFAQASTELYPEYLRTRVMCANRITRASVASAVPAGVARNIGVCVCGGVGGRVCRCACKWRRIIYVANAPGEK